LPRHPVSGHGLEPRVDVFEGSRFNVMHARDAVRRGRTFIEDPEGGVLPRLERLAEDAGFFPEREDPALELGEADLRIYRLERRHVFLRSDERPRGVTVARDRACYTRT